MKRNKTSASKYWCLLIFVIGVTISCQNNHPQLTTEQSKLVKDSVFKLTADIATNISTKGPAAWLNYFEDTPGFFMASDGQLAFTDYPSAKAFILNTLVKSIPHIKLRWENLRIDPLTSNLAAMGADFHEDITNAAGNSLPFDGYFTATAHFNGHSWKLRNLHWSIKKPQQ
jgi:hypothetical protein